MGTSGAVGARMGMGVRAKEAAGAKAWAVGAAGPALVAGTVVGKEKECPRAEAGLRMGAGAAAAAAKAPEEGEEEEGEGAGVGREKEKLSTTGEICCRRDRSLSTGWWW